MSIRQEHPTTGGDQPTGPTPLGTLFLLPPGSPAPSWTESVWSFVLMAALTLFDGVFLSVLATHRLTSVAAAIGIGMTVFSGAGAICAGAELPCSLVTKLGIATGVYLVAGCIAITYGALLPLVRSLFVSDHLLQCLAAVLLVQLALVVSHVLEPKPVPLPVRRLSLGQIGQHLLCYQVTAGVLSLLIGIHVIWSLASASVPYLVAALFPSSDLAVLGVLLAGASALFLSRVARAWVPPCTVPRDTHERAAFYYLRLSLDPRLLLPLLLLVYLTSVVSQLGPRLAGAHVQLAVPVDELELIALSVGAAWAFTCLGMTILAACDDLVYRPALRLSGGMSLVVIAVEELHVPVMSGAPIALLGSGLTISIVLGALSLIRSRVSEKQPVTKQENEQ